MSENLDLMSTPTLSSFTVYIIEDDDAVRKSVVMLLQACGYHCLDFSAAQPFLDFYQQHQMFGCILLDVRMPGMSGMTLHKKLIALGSATPIIFVTAHGDIPMAVEALHSGAVDFISKPYREQDLIEKLNDVQQQQQQLLELNQKVM
ncbi:MAG: response regulator, partial [Pseudomonadales bacterium]|nr:response regulator [Pseudomonadales bacterium]